MQEECRQAGLPEFAAEVAREWAATTDTSGMRGSEERELEEAAAAGLAACGLLSAEPRLQAWQPAWSGRCAAAVRCWAAAALSRPSLPSLRCGRLTRCTASGGQ